MSLAMLNIEDRQNNSGRDILCSSTDLRVIDNITSNYHDEATFIELSDYNEKIKSFNYNNKKEPGELTLTYIRSNDEKRNIKILYNDFDPIRIRTSGLELEKSDIEITRKHLFSSKNGLFLSLFLEDEICRETLRQTDGSLYTVKLSANEYRSALRNNMSPFFRDGDYRVSLINVLIYRLENQQLADLRLLVEDALELWKEHMLRMSDEDLYYYARHFRMVYRQYQQELIKKKSIKNLRAKKTAVLFSAINLIKVI